MELNPLICNTSARNSDELLEGMGGEQVAPNMGFIRREGRTRRVRFAKRNTGDGPPFLDAQIDPGSAVCLAIGDTDAAPTSGTFAMSYDGLSTGLTGLSYGITAAALSTALNANANIISAGGVTVTASGSGAWIVTFLSASARPLFVESANALVPPSTFTARRIQTGDEETVEIQLITLRQRYLAFSNDFAPVAAGTVGITHVQTGSGSQPDIWRITISGEPSGGTFLAKSTAFTAIFPFDATAADLQSKIGTIYTVTKKGPHSWDLVALTNATGPTVTVNGDGLTFADTWEGSLVLSTVNLWLAFAASQGADLTTKFEIQVTEPGGQPAKVYQAPCIVRADVIDADNLVIPGAPSPSNLITVLPSVTGLTGGGETNLDGVSTTAMTVPRIVVFEHATLGLMIYRLVAGTDGESTPNVIRPDDYNGATNQKVWYLDSVSVNGLIASTLDVSSELRVGNIYTAGGVTGAQTIDKPAGSVNFAAAATSLTVDNSLVSGGSIILATVASNDATMKSVSVVTDSGQFTIYANAAPTAETRVNFLVFN